MEPESTHIPANREGRLPSSHVLDAIDTEASPSGGTTRGGARSLDRDGSACGIDASRVNGAQRRGDIPRNRRIVDNFEIRRGYLSPRWFFLSNELSRGCARQEQGHGPAGIGVDNLLIRERLGQSPGCALGLYSRSGSGVAGGDLTIDYRASRYRVIGQKPTASFVARGLL